jgi:WD40 repeat protein
MKLNPLFFVFFIGCTHWPESQTITLDSPLWDTDIVTLDDGVYAMLPLSGKLARIGTDDTWQLVGLLGAKPMSMRANIDHTQLVTHVEWPMCDDDRGEDDPPIQWIEDCPDGALYWDAEVAIIDAGKRIVTAPVAAHINGMELSPDGTTALLYMNDDVESEFVTGPVIDLSEIIFLDMETGDTQTLSIGFMPQSILFTQDGTRAVILSQSKVLILDMIKREILVSYPLTLDADMAVVPSSAVLSPDDRYVLISIEGRPDLYKLDLEVVSIDLEALDGVPSALASDPLTSRTVIVYKDSPTVDVIVDHTYIERHSIPLDEPATDIALQDGIAVLYNTTDQETHDIVKLDLASLETTEYVTHGAIATMRISPEGNYAVATIRPSTDVDNGGLEGFQSSHWGLAIADLHGNSVVSLVLEAEPVGVELIAHEDKEYALLLLDGVHTLISIDLSTPGSHTTVELPSSPASIDVNPRGGFTIAHRSALGQVSFFDPSSGELQTTSGFAAAQFFTEEEILPRQNTD